MAAQTDHDSEITHKFRFFQVHKDGRVHKFLPTADKIPPYEDPITGVQSKDAVVSSNPPVSVRIFLPKSANPPRKLPLLFYVHGGGFCMQSAFSSVYHNFVNNVASKAEAIAVSVEYGLFPDRPIPACYDDSWAALQWVATHVDGNGPEPWLNDYANLNRVYIAGDSAGGNITNTLVNRVGTLGLPGVRVVGAVLMHPYFGGVMEDDEMWMYMCPENKGLEDPRMRPAAENLGNIRCERVLVFVAEKDHLREPGKRYVEELRKSEWSGSVEIVEHVGVDHVFHMRTPKDDQSVDLVNKFISFIKQD